MMRHAWDTVRLGEHCTKIGSGATPRGGESVYLEEGVAFIRSQNVYNGHFTTEGLVYLDDEYAEKLQGVTVERGDILLNITGDSVARSCLVPDDILPARVNQHVAIIRPNPDDFDLRFIGYYLISPFMQEKRLISTFSNTLHYIEQLREEERSDIEILQLLKDIKKAIEKILRGGN